MPTVKVYNMAGQVTGEVELSESVFGIEPNEQAVHASVKQHLANMRQGTQSALTRAEEMCIRDRFSWEWCTSFIRIRMPR